jgi:hypothetical protein
MERDNVPSAGPRVGCSSESPLAVISVIIAARNPSLIPAIDLVRLSEHRTHSSCGEGFKGIG